MNEIDVDERDDEILIINEEVWNLLAAEVTFEDYLNCGTDIKTSELRTMDELIENKLYAANLNDDEECKEIISPSFKYEMDCIKRTYFLL